MPPDSSPVSWPRRVRQTDLGQPHKDHLLHLGVPIRGVLAKRKGNVLADRHAVKQGGVLKHETEPDSLLRQLPIVQLCQTMTVEEHFAASRPQQAGQRLQ
jgi:hypothetical protein